MERTERVNRGGLCLWGGATVGRRITAAAEDQQGSPLVSQSVSQQYSQLLGGKSGGCPGCQGEHGIAVASLVALSLVGGLQAGLQTMNAMRALRPLRHHSGRQTDVVALRRPAV